jgi:hypothetical protein
MSYGINVKNTDGDIIIDGIYKNFAEVASGSITMTGFSVGFDTISFTEVNQPVLIALRPAEGKNVVLWGYRKTGSNYDGFYVMGTAGGNLDYKVFIGHPALSEDNYGMRIFDASGNLVFESSNKYFNVYSVNTGISLAVPDFATEDTAGTYYDISHPGISDPYYFLSPLGYYARKLAINEFKSICKVWRTGIKKISSTSVRVSWNPPIYAALWTPGTSAIAFNPNYNLMVLK